MSGRPHASTCGRASSSSSHSTAAITDDSALLASALRELAHLALELPVLFPIHPRTRAAIGSTPVDGVARLEPLEYVELLSLEAAARIALTDSVLAALDRLQPAREPPPLWSGQAAVRLADVVTLRSETDTSVSLRKRRGFGLALSGRRRVTLAVRLIGLALSLVFAYVAVRGVDFEEAWRVFKESDGWWILPCLAALAAGVFVRVARWLLLFSPETRPGFRPAASALLIGAFFNNILPARAGEIARVVALRQTAGTSRLEALGTVISERIYDVLSLFVLLFVALPFLPEVTWVRAAAITGIVLTLTVIIFLLALARWGERPIQFLLRPLSRLPGFSVERTDLGAGSLIRGLTAGRHARSALGAVALTTVSWIVFSISYWFLMLGFHLELNVFAGLLVLVATNLAMIVPSSPASLGVFEGATQVALSAYGVEPSVALPYALVLHFVNFAPYVVIGYPILHRHTQRAGSPDERG